MSPLTKADQLSRLMMNDDGLYRETLGNHTIDIECRDGLSTGVNRMLVGSRVGEGLLPPSLLSVKGTCN